MKKTALASAFILAATIIPGLHASALDQQTSIRFNAPFEIPGKILPAGTYVFKSLPTNRNVVRIFNQDQTKIYATLETVTDPAITAPDKAKVQFEEKSGAAPEMLHAWFYPGDPYGHEFVYNTD